MMEKFLPVGGKRTAYYCGYCHRDITLGQPRIHCCHEACEDKLDLCMDCFVAGAALLPHEKTHDYRVSDCLDFPVFTKDWTASEELLLLEGIDRFGAGNCKVIADFIGSKGTKQVEDHYWDHYLGIHGFCLPPKVFDQYGSLVDTFTLADRDVSSQGLDPSEENSLYLTKVFSGCERGEEVGREKGSQTVKVNDIREKIASMPGAELPGYMPLREDFDLEFDNDAEVILADMEFDPADDHPSEVALKLQIIRIYNQKLNERNERKRFVIDRGLVDVKKQQSIEKKLTKEERELTSRLRVFSRFHSAAEHEALVDGILRARKLRQNIELLQLYRRMGLKSLASVKHFEADRRKRDLDAKSKKIRDESEYLYENGRNAGSTTSQSLDPTSRRRRSIPSFSQESSSSTAMVVETVGEEVEDGSEDPLDLRMSPGYDLLAPDEQALCAKLPIFPLQYLAIKEAIVREVYRNGSLTSEGLKRILKIDPAKVDQFYDFFIRIFPVNGDADSRGILFLQPKFYTAHIRQKSLSQPAGGAGEANGAAEQTNENGNMAGGEGEAPTRGHVKRRKRSRLHASNKTGPYKLPNEEETF